MYVGATEGLALASRPKRRHTYKASHVNKTIFCSTTLIEEFIT